MHNRTNVFVELALGGNKSAYEPTELRCYRSRLRVECGDAFTELFRPIIAAREALIAHFAALR